MSFPYGFSLARQKNACTYSTGLSHSSYNILRLIIVELLDAPVHQNIFMSQIVALPSNYQLHYNQYRSGHNSQKDRMPPSSMFF